MNTLRCRPDERLIFQSKSASSDALELATKGYITLKNTENVRLVLDEAVSETKKAVTQVTNLAQSLEEGAGPQTDLALNDAQSLVDSIKESLPNMKKKNRESKDALDKSLELRTKMAQNASPLAALDQSLKSLKNKTDKFENDLSDIKNRTSTVKDKIQETKLINDANKYTLNKTRNTLEILITVLVFFFSDNRYRNSTNGKII